MNELEFNIIIIINIYRYNDWEISLFFQTLTGWLNAAISFQLQLRNTIFFFRYVDWISAGGLNFTYHEITYKFGHNGTVCVIICLMLFLRYCCCCCCCDLFDPCLPDNCFVNILTIKPLLLRLGFTFAHSI